jgi:hypothetical protein
MPQEVAHNDVGDDDASENVAAVPRLDDKDVSRLRRFSRWL